MNANQIWEKVGDLLKKLPEKELRERGFIGLSVFHEMVVPIKVQDRQIQLGAPNDFSVQSINVGCRQRFESLLVEVSDGQVTTLVAKVTEGVAKLYAEQKAQEKKQEELDEKERRQKARQRAKINQQKQLRETMIAAGLNPELSSSMVVRSKSNRHVSHAVAKVMAALGQSAVNPLVIRGSAGTGKRTLALEVVRQVTEKGNGRVIWFTGEQWQEDCSKIGAAGFDGKYQKILQLKKLDGVSLVVIYDVDQITGFRSRQWLYELIVKAQKAKPHPVQVVLTTKVTNLNRLFPVSRWRGHSDEAFADRKQVAESLRKVILAGLSVKLKEPDMELRQAIVRTRFEAQGFRVHSDVANFLASWFTDLDQLLGAIKSLINHYEAEGQKAITDVAEIVRELDLTDLAEITGRFSQAIVSSKELRSGKRTDGKDGRPRGKELKRQLSQLRRARQLVMLLGVRLLSLKVTEVMDYLKMDWREVKQSDHYWKEWAEANHKLGQDPDKFLLGWQAVLGKIPGTRGLLDSQETSAPRQLSLFDPPKKTSPQRQLFLIADSTSAEAKPPSDDASKGDQTSIKDTGA